MIVKKNIKDKEKKLLDFLSSFPKMILQNHEVENLAEFVLHDLCSDKCFDITRAAYFVNNTDFNCFKGVAGYEHSTIYKGENLWLEHKNFTSHMRDSNFNKSVRDYNHTSFTKLNEKNRVSEISAQYHR